MLSSSLFLRSRTTLIAALSLVSVPVSAGVIPSVSQTTLAYQLDTAYNGSNFFNGMDFYSNADPSNGFVTYNDQSTSASKGLISQNPDGSWYVGVDHSNPYAWKDSEGNPLNYAGVNGIGRDSVRFQTEKTWQYGLFIADIAHMPGGLCGTWPAFWTIGDGVWPTTGEIDIIESSNALQNTLSSLHTGGSCSIAGDSRTQSGTLQHTDCDYESGGNPVGCGVTDDSSNNYGTGFNAGSVASSGKTGGGVYAMEWRSGYIAMWFFPRSSVPLDLYTDSPNPSGWGVPYANLTGSCDFGVSNFKNHRIVVDNTFCGDLGDATWGTSGCSAQASTCTQFVAENPTAFTNAYWTFNAIKVFQLQSVPVPTATSTTSTTSRYAIPTSFSISTQPGVSFPAPTPSTSPYTTPTSFPTPSSYSRPSSSTPYVIPTSFSISTQPGVSFPGPSFPSPTTSYSHSTPSGFTTPDGFFTPSFSTSYVIPTSFSITTQPGVSFPAPSSSPSFTYSTPSFSFSTSSYATTSFSTAWTSASTTTASWFALTTGWAADQVFGFPKGCGIGPMPSAWSTAIPTTASRTADWPSDPSTTGWSSDPASSTSEWADWDPSTTTATTTTTTGDWAGWDPSTKTTTKATTTSAGDWADWDPSWTSSTTTTTTTTTGDWADWDPSASASSTWAWTTPADAGSTSTIAWTWSATSSTTVSAVATSATWAEQSSWVADPTTTSPFSPVWTGSAANVVAGRVAGVMMAVVGVAVVMV